MTSKAWLFGKALCIILATGPEAAGEEFCIQYGCKLTGPAVTKVCGALEVKNTLECLEIDMTILQRLPFTEFKTTTIWTDGLQRFGGVELKVLFDLIGARGTVLRMTALNNYSIDIPVSDLVAGGPILAYKLNGHQMSRREKGPLWLVYPYDSQPEYQSEIIYSRSIWQIVTIDVLD